MKRRESLSNRGQVDASELIEFLAKSCVQRPEDVQVQKKDREYLLRVAESEEGRVIGRGGRTIAAIRTLARVAAQGNVTVRLDSAKARGGEA